MFWCIMCGLMVFDEGSKAVCDSVSFERALSVRCCVSEGGGRETNLSKASKECRPLAWYEIFQRWILLVFGMEWNGVCEMERREEKGRGEEWQGGQVANITHHGGSKRSVRLNTAKFPINTTFKVHWKLTQASLFEAFKYNFRIHFYAPVSPGRCHWFP